MYTQAQKAEVVERLEEMQVDLDAITLSTYTHTHTHTER